MEVRKDRDYYRCATDRYLIEQVQHGIDVDWRELAVALAERVDELAERVDELARELEDVGGEALPRMQGVRRLPWH